MVKSKDDAMRDFILNQSESLFTVKGYKNTSMDMIAEKCEISKPTLYNYFESKSSMFFALFSRFQSEIAEKANVLMRSDKDKNLIIEEIIDLSLDFVQEKRDFLKMMIRDHHMVVHEHDDVEEHINVEIRRRQEVALGLGEFMKDIVRPEILEEFGVERIGMALSNLLEGTFWDSIKDDSTNHENHEKQKKLIMKLLKSGILV
ncbi:MAG: TetR/AcrR family transcriptional regulator [Candidatus Aminicenantes bacterium]|nr:TetR/AcrR family transcriptional regulator [Candidatus Aminicenantes bacterium]